jgi:hypothetical protein
MISRGTIALGLLVGLAGGCSPYVEGLRYAPHPAVAEVRLAATSAGQQAQPPLTGYATVIGIRREDQKQHVPLSVEVRLRLDNHGPQEVAFDPRTLDLTDAELARFAPPLLSIPQPASIAPEQPYIVQANFPFPPGLSYDSNGMENLQLRWAVQVGGHIVPQSASFQRIHNYYAADPYLGVGLWPAFPGFGFGFGFP